MTMRGHNNAPKLTWFKVPLACGTDRHRLYKNGFETPYFVDVASVITHRTNGRNVGLFGSGMGASIRCRDGSSYQIAACLGSFDKITPAKLRAEQMATT